MTKDEFPEYTLHIVLATVPQQQENVFDAHVQEGFFENPRESAAKLYGKSVTDYGRHRNDKNINVLYNPCGIICSAISIWHISR